MSVLDLSEFKSRANITDTNQDVYLSWILKKFTTVLEEETGLSFSLVSSTTKNYSSKGLYTRFMPIGSWQASGLTVSINENSTTTVLILDTDYRLEYLSGSATSISGIQLYTHYLASKDFLIIQGTYGCGETIPADLDIALYNATLVAYANNKRSGSGIIQSNMIGDVKLEFYNAPEYFHYLTHIANGNLLAVPSISAIIYKYKLKTQQSTFVL